MTAVPLPREATAADVPGGTFHVLDAVRQAMAISDVRAPDQPLVFVNAAFEALTGYSREEVLGQNCRFLQGPWSDQPAVAEIRAAMEQGRPVEVVLRNVRRDGSEFVNELSLSPLHDTTGALTHYVAVQRDQTERRRAVAARDRLQQEASRVATRLQRALLPARLPEVPGLRILERYVPGHLRGEPELVVSGDFYDVMPSRRGWLTVVGDVAGRGLEAAAYTGLARWGLRAHAEVADGLDAVVTHLNATLLGELDERFLTLGAAEWQRLPQDGAWRVRLVLGGHPRPVLVRAGRPAVAVGAPGDLLGLLEEVHLPVAELDLAPGDVLLLYTDGLLEAGPPEDQFGEERLLAELSGGEEDLDEVLDELLAAVSEHHGSPVEDDLTLLAVRVEPVAAA